MLQFAAVGGAFLFIDATRPLQAFIVLLVVSWLVEFHLDGLDRLERAGLRASSRPKLPPASTVSACRTPRPSR